MNLNPMVIEVPMGSLLGEAAILLMNDYHDRRLCQDSLDLYRGGYRLVVNPEDRLILMVALSAGNVVGMSACIVKNDETLNSITVVHKGCRNMGVGAKLMEHKMQAVTNYAPAAYMDTRVSTSNEFSIKACKRAGLKPVTITNEIKDGRTVDFVVMSNRDEPTVEIPAAHTPQLFAPAYDPTPTLTPYRETPVFAFANSKSEKTDPAEDLKNVSKELKSLLRALDNKTVSAAA